jgi:hypothetical protein
MGKQTKFIDKKPSARRYVPRGFLLERWGISHMTLERRLATDPDFPKPVKWSEKGKDDPRARRYWLLADIERYERLVWKRGAA